ncbi:MAG: GreA/GreB family elongation factor [Flavobacteriales bacterium]|nr:MAG: GreA/GreB family elongation factor [Flavobacteriales bacterium]
MSRGFVKEDDQEEAPFIPPRAPLPDGAINYVTPRGLQLLQEEKEVLERSYAQVQGSDVERRREHAIIDGKLALLNERIGSARPVEPVAAPDEVRFGTTVGFTYINGPQKGSSRNFTIVGVDEANVQEQRIAFTAPIARALTGKRVGDVAQFQLGATAQELRVDSIR